MPFGTLKKDERNVNAVKEISEPPQKRKSSSLPALEKDSGFRYVEYRNGRWYGAQGIEVGQFESERLCAYAVAAHFITLNRQVPDPSLLSFPTKIFEKTDASWVGELIADRWDGE